MANFHKGPEYRVENRGYDTPCWIWLMSKNNKGYGVKREFPKLRLAHILYYERAHGSVSQGLELDHLCGVPECVNPDHLEPVTHTENLRRGRRTKLTTEQAREILEAYNAPGEKYGRQSALARQFGVVSQTIRAVILRRTWREV